ncbi:MAG TPA: hypothetical protein DDW27_15300 [Bacteroidales bacterium]|nr:hypothetical protein [Bacteroidales bacterium]
METSFFDSNIFSYGLLPVLIFLARVCDVSLGTLRIIFVSKGKKYIAPFLGFFEVLIWIIAVSRIMQNLDNYINYIAYAAGFASGNFVGMIIEERLAMGIQMIRVFTGEKGLDLIKSLNCNGYGATSIEAHGAKEKIHIIYTIIHRNEIADVLKIINSYNPRAFYTIEDVKSAKEGIFHPRRRKNVIPFSNILRDWRKGK